MHLPDSVYEFLPVIYIFIGIRAIILLDGLLAMISGGILTVAGSLIFVMRRRNRVALAEIDKKQHKKR